MGLRELVRNQSLPPSALSLPAVRFAACMSATSVSGLPDEILVNKTDPSLIFSPKYHRVEIQ